MRVILVHSRNAGDRQPTGDALMKVLGEAGHDVAYFESDAKEWRSTLDGPVDLVVVAGGDGTVTDVALALAGRDVPLAVVPAGTANNIALTLGAYGALEEIVSRWQHPRRARLDIGVARGPWGETRFVEGVGFGAFARTIRESDERREAEGDDGSDRHERLGDDLRTLRDNVLAYPAVETRCVLDGETVSGRHVLVCVLSICSIGPNLRFAPDADPGDGLFDVVLVSERERAQLGDYLTGMMNGAKDPPALPVRRARRISIDWHGPDIHVDSKVWPRRRRDRLRGKEPVAVDIEMTGHTVQALASHEPPPAPKQATVTCDGSSAQPAPAQGARNERSKAATASGFSRVRKWPAPGMR